VRQTHELMSAAIQRGDTKELVSSGAFAISQHYARFTAGLIAAVKSSGLAEHHLAKDHPLLSGIVDLAAQPAIIIGAGEGLEALFLDVDDDPMETNPLAEASLGGDNPSSALVPSQSGVAARCPACNSEYDQGEAATLPLAGLLGSPCRFHHVCWCSDIPRDRKYCRLCVKYYKDKAKQKQRCMLRTDKMEQIRQKKNRKRTEAEAKLVSPSASRRKTSYSGDCSSSPVVRIQEI